ncbi:Hypothetical protein Nlim_1846 [Candidatus Nitrosarchaeum limnium SFB1]|uniref:Uncharacterized protein n=1 Tax=Candidatus Nitrosarchaeum limnium SFB1 TaxID=886738 RepID=F3KMU1_9ARCH|nr:Hypothetical protein Nlim_1846 [Candidatus Nitrosarchaeum limnium SFB1]
MTIEVIVFIIVITKSKVNIRPTKIPECYSNILEYKISLSLILYFCFRGFVLSLYLQQGQNESSHFMKISHIWHLF